MLIAIVNVLSAFSTISVAASDKDFYWDYEVHDKEVHILGCDNRVIDVVIPEKIGGYPVTYVDSMTFCDKGLPVTSITVPKTVEVLGDADFQRPFEGIVGAFEMYFVDKDNKYFSSENGVLYNKDKTVLISVPSKCPLKDYVYPDSVVETNCDAFNDCAFIRTITISRNVQSLDGGDFGYFMSCESLKKIIVDKANDVFSSDNDGVLYNKEKTKLLRFPQNSPITYYIVPDYVEYIRDYAFYNCKNLICIGLGQITCLGWSVFDGCNNFVTIEAPDTLIEVGKNDFDNCDNLSRFLYEGTSEQWERIADRCYPEFLCCVGDDVEMSEVTTETKSPVIDITEVTEKSETKTDTFDTNESYNNEPENKTEEAVDTSAANTKDDRKALKIIIPAVVSVVVISAIVVIVVKNKKK